MITILCSLLTEPATAGDCTDTELSTCFDPDALWHAPASSPWVSIDAGESTSATKATLGLTLEHTRHLLRIRAPSPDPDDTRVDSIRTAFGATFGASYGIGRGVEISVWLPMAFGRTGPGLSPARSLTSEDIAEVALRDPRFGFGFDVLDLDSGAYRFHLKIHHRISLPLGDETALAGERGPVSAPGVSGVHYYRRWTLAAELGLRLRSKVTLGDTRLGSQFFGSLGLGVALFEPGELDLGLEAWVLHGLVSQYFTRADGTIRDNSSAPTEWMLSLRRRIAVAPLLELVAGVGGAIPFSIREVRHADGSRESERYAAIGSVGFRGLLGLRYRGGGT